LSRYDQAYARSHRAEGANLGDSIVGFDEYHHKYAGGRERDWFLTGVSPRRQSLTIYIMPGFDRSPELMKIARWSS
jgi:hypothetical protein